MSLRFDFGPGGAVENGYTKVTEADLYDSEKGYGFVDGLGITYRRREEQPLTGDFCIPFGAAFAVDVKDGNYLVSLTAGDAWAPTCTTVKTNGERLVLREIRTVAGQYAFEQFAVNVRGGQLKLSFSGIAPRINALEITPSGEQITLFLAGDSTVTDSSGKGFPFSGWGQMLPCFFRHDVAVANHAAGGRSSKSFIAEGRLAAIEEELKEGDYLFIQFGHNDQKWDEPRHTDPATTYPEHLRRYIDAARSRKAVPVLVTSVHRRYFDDSGKLKNTHDAYLDAVRQLAEEEAVALIDLAEKSRRLFEELGPEGTKSIFLWGGPGEWMNYAGGIQDNTHFQERGSLRIAELVVEGIRERNLQSLVMFLR
ncbi:G-D-S-L family lipolytic protein [Paenibacillus mucilaginosus 3016]|uniref:G-D-S-L family lipolytic protein n=1 Tax=Paenibacillus mucilaginosus 3016 TaxID=1116391 RepID=H6NJ98_9BACL|nr:rhamnogalacturonan acetylesterase [Paenibacillus mucilaginosus]AFC29177.1 G-D-S-L family lipolytic protein [Paenibacillus mucilaginosus 3016]WFA17911.1 GDSL family lipase [Paenibacillus mucilaginosus]